MDINELLHFVNYDQISLTQIFIRFVFAGFSGIVISVIYKLYHRQNKTNTEMMHTLIFISLIISSAMMIIGNNLASAFGLVGAVSIIRFRTVVKSARDMSFVLFAVVAGMSCGLGHLVLAVSGLAFTGLVMVIVYFISTKNDDVKSDIYRVKISYRGSYTSREYIEKILKENCGSVLFDSMKIDEERLSLIYKISLENINKIESIVQVFEEDTQFTKIKIFFSNWELQN